MSSALVGISPTPVEVPPVVHTLAGRLRPGATVVPVWRNEYGGFTARLEGRRTAPGPGLGSAASRIARPSFRRGTRFLRSRSLPSRFLPSRSLPSRSMRSYLKWVPRSSSCPDPVSEADRLLWAGTFTALPRVLDAGQDAHGSWLLTEAVEVDGLIATSAIEPRWRTLAQRSAIAIGVGLRRFHDALPTDTCPFVRTADLRVAALRGMGLGPGAVPVSPAGSVSPGSPASPAVAAARTVPTSAVVRTSPTPRPPAPHPGPDHTRFPAALADPPPVDRLVVCHGDATVPNTLLDRAGRFAAHVDVGDLGVADRWADLAVTTRSVTRRYGPGLEPLVLAAYGVAPDPERTAYYRALWDAEEAVRVRRAERPRRRTGPRHHLRRAS